MRTVDVMSMLFKIIAVAAQMSRMGFRERPDQPANNNLVRKSATLFTDNPGARVL